MAKINNYKVGSTYKVLTTVPSTATTSTSASITKLLTLTVPANTFATNDVVTIEALLTKSNTTNSHAVYLYFNTSDTLTGATLVASFTGVGATIQYSIITRRLIIYTQSGSGSGTETVSASTSFGDDMGFYNITAANSTLAINWTSTVYIILAGTVAAATSTIAGRWIKASLA